MEETELASRANANSPDAASILISAYSVMPVAVRRAAQFAADSRSCHEVCEMRTYIPLAEILCLKKESKWSEWVYRSSNMLKCINESVVLSSDSSIPRWKNSVCARILSDL